MDSVEKNKKLNRARDDGSDILQYTPTLRRAYQCGGNQSRVIFCVGALGLNRHDTSALPSMGNPATQAIALVLLLVASVAHATEEEEEEAMSGAPSSYGPSTFSTATLTSPMLASPRSAAATSAAGWEYKLD